MSDNEIKKILSGNTAEQIQQDDSGTLEFKNEHDSSIEMEEVSDGKNSRDICL